MKKILSLIFLILYSCSKPTPSAPLRNTPTKGVLVDTTSDTRIFNYYTINRKDFMERKMVVSYTNDTTINLNNVPFSYKNNTAYRLWDVGYSDNKILRVPFADEDSILFIDNYIYYVKMPEFSYQYGDASTIIVKKGMSLTSIAASFGTSVEELKKLNNLHTNTVYTGQYLKVY